jgi:hypothetical protein
MSRPAAFLRDYFRILPALIITICSVRIYEYYFIAFKSFVSHAWYYELLGLLYDVWACLLYATVLLLPCLLLSLLSQKAARVLFHACNVLMIVIYLSLIVVYSERNTPFDHELFTRSLHESWLTTKQMMSSGLLIYLPFLAIPANISCYTMAFSKNAF